MIEDEKNSESHDTLDLTSGNNVTVLEFHSSKKHNSVVVCGGQHLQCRGKIMIQLELHRGTLLPQASCCAQRC